MKVKFDRTPILPDSDTPLPDRLEERIAAVERDINDRIQRVE